VALLAGAIRQRDFRCLFVSALAAGITIAAIRPVPALLAYGGVVAGLWLAVASWLLFPELRRWVPFAATACVLALGAWMVWRGVPGIVVGYGAFAAGTVGFGFALRRVEFQGAGLASATLLAALKHGAWIPQTPGGWGVTLVAAGFLFLSAGVAINLLLARRRAPADTGPV
jgi:hypothetical protein